MILSKSVSDKRNITYRTYSVFLKYIPIPILYTGLLNQSGWSVDVNLNLNLFNLLVLLNSLKLSIFVANTGKREEAVAEGVTVSLYYD